MSEAAAAEDNETEAPRPWTHGLFYWNELNTWEPEKAVRFYSEVRGWEFDKMDMPDGNTYYIAKQGDMMVAGIFPLTSPDMDGAPETWVPYLAVDDIDKRIDAARKAGATIIREPWDVPGTGRMAILQEPGGAILGWMTPSD